MPFALEVRGLAKQFIAGSDTCSAAAHVLRGVDLAIHPGEAVAIVGDADSGKSTLLLCLAGLLRPDFGSIRWFGNSSRASAVRRVVYHITRPDLMRAGRFDEPNIHLIDSGRGIDSVFDLGAWVDLRRAAGDAVVIATRDSEQAQCVAPRIVTLRQGRFVGAPTRARVAELFTS
jgi:predicted ABC-type transport system involved in lysophospholipase L1 biosynthesis ATPase subunit